MIAGSFFLFQMKYVVFMSLWPRNSSPGRFSLALEVGWEKALASAGHFDWLIDLGNSCKKMPK